MAEPTKKISALPEVTASSAADSIPIVRGGVTSRIHPGSGGGLDVDLLDGYQGITLYLPRGHIDGLICSNAADTEHDITIAAGAARDSTNVLPLILASAITKRIDAAWAVGTGNGGIDTGTVAANTVYYVWLIRKDSDGTIDALFSLSKTAPTMPAGYTYKRRIMSLCTEAAANIINFNQINDRIIFKQPIQSRAVSAPANTNRNGYATTCPPAVAGLLSIQALQATTTADLFGWFGSADRTDAAASATNMDLQIYNAGEYKAFEKTIVTDSSRNIFARMSNTGLAFGFFTLGWIDDRGRDV